MSTKTETKKILRCAGAVVAYLIGSGFASGQEVMQYFTAFGPIWGTLGGIITLAIMLVLAGFVMRDAITLRLDDVNEIFTYYCGRFLGNVLKWVMPLFLYSIYVIMLSGAGALLEEYYGIPNIWGRLIMMLLSLVTVILGIQKLTDIIGFIGPLIIVLTVTISALCIIQNPSGIIASATKVDGLSMTKATATWWLSGFNYGAFCGLTLVPFLASLGKDMPGKKAATTGGMLGGGIFAGTAMLLSAGMLSHIESVYDKAVPTVYLADVLLKGAGMVFSLVMFAGIYTTAVPMLWTSINKLTHDEKSWKYKAITIVLGAIAFLGGKLPFGTLVNIVYPYMGYVGIVVLIGILLKRFKCAKSIC